MSLEDFKTMSLLRTSKSKYQYMRDHLVGQLPPRSSSVKDCSRLGRLRGKDCPQGNPPPPTSHVFHPGFSLSHFDLHLKGTSWLSGITPIPPFCPNSVFQKQLKESVSRKVAAKKQQNVQIIIVCKILSSRALLADEMQSYWADSKLCKSTFCDSETPKDYKKKTNLSLRKIHQIKIKSKYF